MAHRRTPHVTLFGNLGGNPETRFPPGRIVTLGYNHALLEFVVLRQFTARDRDFRTACLAIHAKEENGMLLTLRVPLLDCRNLLTPYRRGDRIRVDGYFHFTGRDDRDLRFVTEFVVFKAELQAGKIRQRTA